MGLLTYWKWIAGALGVLAIIGSVWFYGNTKYKSGQSDERESWVIAAQRLEEQQRDKIEALDASWQEKINNAKIENDKLRADVISGAKRLRIAAHCTKSNSATASMDNAGETAELSSADAAALLGIVTDGDTAIRQLTACQDYIKAIRGD